MSYGYPADADATNEADAARAVVANKEQFRVSQMTNDSISNRKVILMRGDKYIICINFDIYPRQF
jgi:hypothetical protein